MDDFDDLSNDDFLSDLESELGSLAEENSPGNLDSGKEQTSEDMFDFAEDASDLDDFDFLDDDYFGGKKSFLSRFKLPKFLKRKTSESETSESETPETETPESEISEFEPADWESSDSKPSASKISVLKQFDRTQKIVLGVLAGFAILVYVVGGIFIARGGSRTSVGGDIDDGVAETGTALFLEGEALQSTLAIYRGTQTAQAFQHQLDVAFTLTVSYSQTQIGDTSTPVPTATFTLPPLSTATPSGAEDTQTPEPGSTESGTSVPTGTATVEAAACSCSGDTYSCADFSSHAEAQSCYEYCIAQEAGDIHQLDGNSNGDACESLH